MQEQLHRCRRAARNWLTAVVAGGTVNFPILAIHSHHPNRTPPDDFLRRSGQGDAVDKKLLAYWAATGLFCLVMFGGGVADLLRMEDMRATFARLGYPEYLLTLLGVAKLSGAAAVLAPGFPRLKEWAYAGFAFDLIGATVSHAVVGDPFAETAPPALLLAVCAASYLLRPESRRLADPIKC